jgi:hypothetical protein
MWSRDALWVIMDAHVGARCLACWTLSHHYHVTFLGSWRRSGRVFAVNKTESAIGGESGSNMVQTMILGANKVRGDDQWRSGPM